MLSRNIKTLAYEKDKNLKQISIESGVNYSSLLNWTRGVVKNPGIDNLRKLAKYFGVSLDKLVNEDISCL